MATRLFRSERTLVDGTVLIGTESDYDHGFIVTLGRGGPASNRGEGGRHYWMDYVDGEGWKFIRWLTEEETSAAAEMRAEYWHGPHCPWTR